jgi:hypothetical protein
MMSVVMRDAEAMCNGGTCDCATHASRHDPNRTSHRAARNCADPSAAYPFPSRGAGGEAKGCRTQDK